jgi:hypothetical protein
MMMALNGTGKEIGGAILVTVPCQKGYSQSVFFKPLLIILDLGSKGPLEKWRVQTQLECMNRIKVIYAI